MGAGRGCEGKAFFPPLTAVFSLFPRDASESTIFFSPCVKDVI